MAIVERHKSSSELPDLIVDVTENDWSIGFDGGTWHTHGDILDWSGYAGTREERVRAFVDDVIASRRVIVLSRVNGEVRDAWITDDPSYDEMKYAEPNETIEKRLWNGQAATG